MLKEATFAAWQIGLGTALLLPVGVPPRNSTALCDDSSFIHRVAVLSADSMQGRWPGTRGSERAARYIAAEFRSAGLRPVNGSFLQPVPLISQTVRRGSLVVRDVRIDSENPADSTAVIETDLLTESVTGQGDVLFVGFGISAPESGWEDFGGQDVRGRILLVMSGVPDSAQLRLPWGTTDARGADSYKIAIARARGARGIVFLLASHLARHERFTLDTHDARNLSVIARLGRQPSIDLAKGLGTSIESLEAAALVPKRGDRRTLLTPIKFDLRQDVRHISSANVVGVLPGRHSDSGVVLFTAHYDHLGIRHGQTVGDSVFHGALDNASGVSAMVCLAERFASDGATPHRTLIFVATTAEEQPGHLGAAWYVSHPTVSLARMIVVLNTDGINTIAPTDDFLALPASVTDASTAVDLAGKSAGMRLSEVDFERGFDYSFDTEQFNRRGVGALTIWQGLKGRGLSEQEFFTRSRARNKAYHTPADTLASDWNTAAIRQHLTLIASIGAYFAAAGPKVRLNPRSPFSMWDADLLAGGKSANKSPTPQILERSPAETNR